MSTHDTKLRATLQSLAEIETTVRAFLSCDVFPSEFGHRAHLTVALWLLCRFPEEEATARMRDGLRRLLARHNLDGYHETITLFWLRAVRRFLNQADAAIRADLPELNARLLAHYADSRLLLEYYSRELLHSAAAKAAWVEPDLKTLDV